MKAEIHPDYKEVKVACACGETFATKSTRQDIHLDICSKCHPFYTGKQKLVDTAGRVEKFKKRLQTSQTAGVKHGSRREKLAKKDAKKAAARVEK